MRLKLISEGLDFTIQGYDENEDPGNIGRACHSIANEAGIRISRNKELTFVAMTPDGPAGAVWSAFERDAEASEYSGQDVFRFDFDVAVSQATRATGLTSARIGPQLIEAALDYYKSLKAEHPGAYIRVWVVNSKLARYLEDKYGFETEGRHGWSPDAPHMSYHA
jgi:GNAT superfamily N-acetyltransferase